MYDSGRLMPYLRDDEQLLWSGCPDPRALFTSADIFMVPFSILWCGFAIFWEAGVVRSGWGFGEVWGVPFVAVGLYFVVGRFFYKHYRNRRTVYGITTRRAMIAGPRSFSDMPLPGQQVDVRWAGNARRASVVIGGIPPRGWGRRQSPAMYANTGLELFGRGGMPFAFYDVNAPEAMLQALEQARS